MSGDIGAERLDGAREMWGDYGEMWGDIPSESERPHAPGRDGSVQDCSRVVSHPLGRARYGEMWGDEGRHRVSLTLWERGACVCWRRGDN